MRKKDVLIPEEMLDSVLQSLMNDSETARLELSSDQYKQISKDSVESCLRWLSSRSPKKEHWDTASNAERMPEPWYSNSRNKWEVFAKQWNNREDIDFVDLLIFFVGCYNERYDEQEQEVNGATLGPIPTEDETKGQYIGVPGVAPHPVKELLNNGHCPTCGADYTKPDVPYAHKSAAGNIMPGHTDTKQTHVSDVADWQDGAPKSKPTGLMAFEISTEQEFTEQIKDLLWHDDEYESKDKHVNDRLIEAFRRGKGCK